MAKYPIHCPSETLTVRVEIKLLDMANAQGFTAPDEFLQLKDPEAAAQ